jgi:Protein of unknown function (DUF1559)
MKSALGSKTTSATTSASREGLFVIMVILLCLALNIVGVRLLSDFCVCSAWVAGFIAILASGHFTLGQAERGAKNLAGIVAGVCLIVVAVGIVLYPTCKSLSDNVRNASAREQLGERMTQILLAMHAYADKHNAHLPPSAIYSKDDKPLLSWRVALLPYLGHNDLYGQFNLDEPWDNPHNLALAAKMPDVYTLPSFFDDGNPPDTTYFQVFVGSGAAFEGRQGLHMPRDFPDGTSNTLLFALAQEPVLWTKPQDMPFTPNGPVPRLRSVKSSPHYRASSSYYRVMFADGSWRDIPATITDDELRVLITRNGGEPMPKWLYE